MADANQKYPDLCVQSLLDNWWIEDSDKNAVVRGRLLKTFSPYVDMEPYRLIPDGRTDDTEHKTAKYVVEPWTPGKARKTNKNLPVAALPEWKGEMYLTRRAKLRPVVVLGEAAPEVDRKRLAPGSAKWQTNPTILVAPYYGVDQDGSRGGWNPVFVERIQRCEYPQYVFDSLPLASVSGSVLRLDHAFSIGRHYKWYEWTDYRLSAEAVEIMDQWFDWFRTGTLSAETTLGSVRKMLLEA